MAERNWDDTGLTTSDTISTTEWEDMTQNNIIPSKTHMTSDGSDHSYIDQNVTVFSTPTFDELTITSNTTLQEVGRAGEALVAGDLVYLKSDGKYWKVNAAAYATTAGKIMIASESISADMTGRYYAKGKFTTTGLTAGSTYFVSTTAGEFTATAPSTSGQFVRAIGVAISTTVLDFQPSLDVYEVA